MLSMEILDGTIASNGLINFCRYMVAFLGVIHLIFAVVRFLNHQAFWTAIAFMATGLLTALQQIEALGDPLVPWRLPLYAFMNVAGIIYLYKLGPTRTDIMD